MKKIMFTLLCCVMATFTINAQTLSGNEVVDEMLKHTDTSELEEAFAQQGVNLKIRAYFDSEQNELVFNYRCFDEKIFDIFNAEQGLLDAISGMANAVMTEDKTGNYLIWMGNEFNRTHTGMRVEFLYKDQKKTASATSGEIMDIIYKMFQ